MSSHFPQGDIKVLSMVYKVLHRLVLLHHYSDASHHCLASSGVVTLASAVPQTYQAHSCLRAFVLALPSGSNALYLLIFMSAFFTSFRSHSSVIRGMFSNYPARCNHSILYPSYFILVFFLSTHYHLIHY